MFQYIKNKCVLSSILLATAVGSSCLYGQQEAALNSLIPAIGHGNLAGVARSVEANPELVNARDGRGWTLLHWAAQMGHLDIVEFLVLNGANVNSKNKKGLTPLHLGALRDHLDIVKFLVLNGADVNARDSRGSTLLHRAAMKGHLDVVKFLVQNGAEIDAVTNKGESALQLALRYRKVNVAKYLIERYANVGELENELQNQNLPQGFLEETREKLVKILKDEGLPRDLYKLLIQFVTEK